MAYPDEAAGAIESEAEQQPQVLQDPLPAGPVPTVDDILKWWNQLIFFEQLVLGFAEYKKTPFPGIDPAPLPDYPKWPVPPTNMQVFQQQLKEYARYQEIYRIINQHELVGREASAKLDEMLLGAGVRVSELDQLKKEHGDKPLVKAARLWVLTHPQEYKMPYLHEVLVLGENHRGEVVGREAYIQPDAFWTDIREILESKSYTEERNRCRYIEKKVLRNGKWMYKFADRNGKMPPGSKKHHLKDEYDWRGLIKMQKEHGSKIAVIFHESTQGKWLEQERKKAEEVEEEEDEDDPDWNPVDENGQPIFRPEKDIDWDAGLRFMLRQEKEDRERAEREQAEEAQDQKKTSGGEDPAALRCDCVRTPERRTDTILQGTEAFGHHPGPKKHRGRSDATMDAEQMNKDTTADSQAEEGQNAAEMIHTPHGRSSRIIGLNR